jgi:formylglycine-generating enzyme required for sulfatase activity
MAKYPVTVAQFNAFLAENPAENDSLWDGMPGEDKDFMGKSYPVREFKETRDDYANHPRTSVSWYQAIAFCRWLTQKYHAAGLLDKSLVIWLPHEQWWEKAARGADDGREYPYEGEFDTGKGNTRETNIGSTSAVGAFPTGASPYGLLDASGNAWEWCASKRDEPDMLVPDDSGASRVLRGGSFSNVPINARVSYRSSDNPVNRNLFSGFRVCCVRPAGGDIAPPRQVGT